MWLEIGVARSPVSNDAVLTESAQRQWPHVAGPRDRAEHLVQRHMRPRRIVQLVFGAPIGPRSDFERRPRLVVLFHAPYRTTRAPKARGEADAGGGFAKRGTPFVARVIIANPLQVKAIAQAHVKTDKIDAGTLASLQAAGYLPQIWTPDAVTERKRRLAARRY